MEENKKHTNDSGFKIPDKYFENFERQLVDSLSNTTEDTPVLPEVNTSGFKVPDHYFENFQESFLPQLQEKKKTTKIISMGVVKRLVYLSGVAAVIALALILWSQNQIHTSDFESITVSDIQHYFSDENIDIDEDELAMLLGNEADLMESFEDLQISDEVIEDYLSKEDLENDVYIE